MTSYTTTESDVSYVVDADGLALDILDFVTDENPTPFRFDTLADAEAFAAQVEALGYANPTIIHI